MRLCREDPPQLDMTAERSNGYCEHAEGRVRQAHIAAEFMAAGFTWQAAFRTTAESNGLKAVQSVCCWHAAEGCGATPGPPS